MPLSSESDHELNVVYDEADSRYMSIVLRLLAIQTPTRLDEKKLDSLIEARDTFRSYISWERRSFPRTLPTWTSN